MGLLTGSFGEEQARLYPSSQNYARFELLTDFQTSLLVPMVATNLDLLQEDERLQLAQLREIIALAYLPTCSPGPNPEDPDILLPPVFSSSPIVGIYHTYTFNIRVNDQNTQYSTAFVYNADRQQSRGVLATFDSAITKLEVTARRDFIDPAWQGDGVNVQLALLLMFNVFTK